MSEGVRGFQKKTEGVGECQTWSKTVIVSKYQRIRKCQRMSEGVRECQRVLEGVRGCQRVSEGVRGCQRLLEKVR